MAKRSTKKAAAKPVEADTGTETTEEAPTSGHAAQTGMEAGPSPKEQRDALNKKFEEADEKGKAAIIDETQVGLGIRGY